MKTNDPNEEIIEHEDTDYFELIEVDGIDYTEDDINNCDPDLRNLPNGYCEEVKNVRFSCLLTKTEYRTMKDLAQNIHLNIPDYLRVLLLQEQCENARVLYMNLKKWIKNRVPDSLMYIENFNKRCSIILNKFRKINIINDSKNQ